MNDKDFAGIMEGLGQAKAFTEGATAGFRVTVPEKVDVKAIRKAMGMTQEAFAARFGFSKGALRDWEQDRRQPEASARVLLKVIEKRPEAVVEALSA